ncbi:hypothetical protein HanRHA438_Chr15g0707621 [Helianthus annuus]|nr:hypothetical protein HanRHA438_Chr15g0707621 [Helianthus annuus]
MYTYRCVYVYILWVRCVSFMRCLQAGNVRREAPFKAYLFTVLLKSKGCGFQQRKIKN